MATNVAQRTAHDVGIICPLHVNEYLSNASPKLQVKGFRLPQVKNTGRIIAAASQLLSVRNLARYKPDIVHETYYAACRIAPVAAKVVLTVYDMIHKRFAEQFSANDRTAACKAAAVARADHMICISENTRRDLIEILSVDPRETSVAYLGFTQTQQLSDKSFVATRPYLLYVGHRGGYKNFDTLLQAYASNQSLMSNYDLIAFGEGGWTNAELNRAKNLGINAKCLRKIQGDDSVLASLYSNASLFIYPSLYEGFGILPPEAMGFGCPVVCRHASSLPEVVGDAAELFDPESPTSLLNAVERLLNDFARRKTLIERAQARTQEFSWSKCSDQTVEIYQRLT